MSSKKEQTKQKIIDAFWELYETTRIEKITIKEICYGAHINRSTFYEYFSDVYEVLETIENSLIPNEKTIPVFNESITHDSLMVKKQLEFFDKNKKYLRVLLSETGNPSFRFKIRNTIKPIVLSLVKESERPENFEYILEYSIWGMIGVLHYHINRDEPCDEQAILQTIQKLSVSSLLPTSMVK